MFDRSGDGDIDAKELRKELFSDQNISDNVMNKIIEQVDGDGSGSIDLQEFRELMESLKT